MAGKTFVVVVGVCLLHLAVALWPAFPTNTAAESEGKFNFQTARTTQPACSCLEELKTLENHIRVSLGRLENFQHRMDEMSAEMYQVQNGMRALRTGFRPALSQTQDVSFSARVGTHRPYLKDVETIIFDDITINNANAYDPYSGKFNAPAIGVYFFQATILSGFNSTIESMFVLNGNEVGRLYSGAFNNRGSGSSSVLLNLKQGDEVSVNLFYGNGDYVHGQWSSFSGFAVTLFS